MKQFSCILCLFLLAGNTSYSQKVTAIEPSYPELSLRTSLTSWIDYDAGLMLGINYRWSKQYSASLEPSWILYNGPVSDENGKIIPSGFKIRADFRFHMPRRNSREPDFFVAPEFHYKTVGTKKEDLFGINCLGGQCAYFQQAVYTEKKREIGGLVKAGMITPLTFINKNNRLNFEVYVGVGIKTLRFTETDLPIGGAFVNPPNRSLFQIGNQTSLNKSIRPMLPAGLKLSFILK